MFDTDWRWWSQWFQDCYQTMVSSRKVMNHGHEDDWQIHHYSNKKDNHSLLRYFPCYCQSFLHKSQFWRSLVESLLNHDSFHAPSWIRRWQGYCQGQETAALLGTVPQVPAMADGCIIPGVRGLGMVLLRYNSFKSDIRRQYVVRI